ncbi:hypothetical protein [Faecalibacillus intestinalis]|nr:hypothetical protein [Faecalibacillus intestinalis]
MENKEKQKRGMSSQKRNIVCAIDQHNNKVIQVSETGRIHSKELYKIYKDKIPSTCQVVSDSTLKKINDLHSSIDLFLYKYRGISDKYLRNYIGLYKYKDQHNKYYQKKIFLHIFKEIGNSLCALKFSNFKYDSKFFTI